MSKVRCKVCQQLRASEKYRRHLRLHVKAGEITFNDAQEIIFQSKFTRRDCKSKMGISIGYKCTVQVDDSTCGVYVMDLRSHLLRIHNLSDKDEEFVLALENSTCCGRSKTYNSPDVNRQVFNRVDLLKIGILPIRDSPVDVEASMVESISNQTFHSAEKDGDQSYSQLLPQLDPNSSTCETGDDTGIVTTDDEIENMLLKHPFLTRDLSHMLNSFKKFLHSKWGGSKNESSVKVIVSNMIKLIGNVGADNIWNPGYINRFLSMESHCLSSTTLLSRLQAFGQFIKYLKIDFPHALPTNCALYKIESMITGIKTTLRKERNSHQKSLMSKTRRNMQHSINCLSEWRSRRGDTIDLNQIRKFRENDQISLTIKDYKRFRDFFIPELIIPNAQRSGVIQGAIIDEVLYARNSVTPEGLHRLMIAEHKTGSTQSATLFLYPDVFQGLDTFVSCILPKMNIYQSNELALTKNSLIFQTWNGSPLSSSLVGIRFRRALSGIGIQFNGTITDLRKAAATLTGIHYPEMQDMMSSFMCHSSAVHHKHYRVSMGHYGMTKPFFALEDMQKKNFTQSIGTSSIQVPTCSCTGTNESFDLNFESSNSQIDKNLTNIALTSIHPDSCRNLKNIALKDCRISLTRFMQKTSSKSAHQEVPERRLVCKKLERHSIFDNVEDENLFLSVFSSFIFRVSNRENIFQNEIWLHAQSESRFTPLLSKLLRKFPSSLSRVLLDKVKQSGYSMHSKRFSLHV